MKKNELIRQCIRHHCMVEYNFGLSKLEELFYTTKGIVCILFNREYKGTESSWLRKEFITVAMHSFHKFYNYEFGQEDARFIDVTVGYGLKNWYYNELGDGWL